MVNEKNKVLLTWNKNLQTWIPVGGHIDPGETPEEAIKREVSEETGFDFEFLSPHENDKDGNVKLLRHQRVQIEDAPHHNHHMNFVFFGKCTKHHERETTDENEKLRWFSAKDIKEMKEKMFGSVYSMSLEALRQAESI